MRLLLDTHIFLWFISGDTRLSPDWCERIREVENEVYVSVVSFWEIMIKQAINIRRDSFAKFCRVGSINEGLSS